MKEKNYVLILKNVEIEPTRKKKNYIYPKFFQKKCTHKSHGKQENCTHHRHSIHRDCIQRLKIKWNWPDAYHRRWAMPTINYRRVKRCTSIERSDQLNGYTKGKVFVFFVFCSLIFPLLFVLPFVLIYSNTKYVPIFACSVLPSARMDYTNSIRIYVRNNSNLGGEISRLFGLNIIRTVWYI